MWNQTINLWRLWYWNESFRDHKNFMNMFPLKYKKLMWTSICKIDGKYNEMVSHKLTQKLIYQSENSRLKWLFIYVQKKRVSKKCVLKVKAWEKKWSARTVMIDVDINCPEYEQWAYLSTVFLIHFSVLWRRQENFVIETNAALSAA